MESGRRDWTRFVVDRFIWLVILGVFLFFAFNAEGFVSSTNLVNILMHASVLGLLTIGQAICLFCGNFDLSAEGTAALAAMSAAWLMVPSTGIGNFGIGWELHPFIVIPVILLMGAIIGWFNGFMITRMGMNAFIVTLAMQLVLHGAAFFVSQGNSIANIPKLFLWMGSGKIGSIPVQLIVTGLAFIGFHYFLRHSGFGRQLFAVGGNREAAHASGFDTKKIITIAFVLSGTLGAAAGWMDTGRIGEATWTVASGLALESVAAAVIGGVALQGGIGSIGGAFAGVLLLAVVDNGLNLMKMDPFWVNGVRGFIILVALVIEAQKFRYRPRSARFTTPASPLKGRRAI